MDPKYRAAAAVVVVLISIIEQTLSSYRVNVSAAVVMLWCCCTVVRWEALPFDAQQSIASLRFHFVRVRVCFALAVAGIAMFPILHVQSHGDCWQQATLREHI